MTQAERCRFGPRPPAIDDFENDKGAVRWQMTGENWLIFIKDGSDSEPLKLDLGDMVPDFGTACWVCEQLNIPLPRPGLAREPAVEAQKAIMDQILLKLDPPKPPQPSVPARPAIELRKYPCFQSIHLIVHWQQLPNGWVSIAELPSENEASFARHLLGDGSFVTEIEKARWPKSTDRRREIRETLAAGIKQHGLALELLPATEV